MVSAIETVLQRYQMDISDTMRRAMEAVSTAAMDKEILPLEPFYGQMRYHLGWVDRYFTAIANHPGKLLRPTLLLLSYEACMPEGSRTGPDEPMSHLRRALPAAAAIEFAHNFTLLHDDIEDGDAERRHRATVWKLWGIPHAINTGDGMYSLARLALWDALQEQVASDILVKLARLFDHTLLLLTEGQHLDISFEEVTEITVDLYMSMIERKTAALIGCATEMGATLGTHNTSLIGHMRQFGWALGLAFQVRDDILGIWASKAESGKQQAGDIYRRKKSLPIVHALMHADRKERQFLHTIYAQDTPMTPEQVRQILAILEQTGARAYCSTLLITQCQQARSVLHTHEPERAGETSARARKDLLTVVDFVEAIAHSEPIQRV